MNVLVAVDAQLFRTPDGKVWTKTIYGYDFWKRYLDVFETISVVSRMKDVDHSEVIGYLRSDGERVRFKPLPMARGMKQYLKQWFDFKKKAKEAVKGEECAVIRLPSIAATFVEYYFKKTHKPYVLEIVVDPLDAYAENRLAQKVLTMHLKHAVKQANGVSYVTQYALQERYPCRARIEGESERYFETYYSSIILKKEFFGEPRDYNNIGKRLRIVHTANNINNYVKGHEVVIRVVKQLRDNGYDVSACFIGDGDKRSEFENLANELGIGEHITFTGMLASSDEVRRTLMENDLFLFPTKAEGLPRAVIEAMAVGLPCLSTPVNGIPELLEAGCMFDPVDVNGFSGKITELLKEPEKMNEMSARNIQKAFEYEERVLRTRRMRFYSRIEELADSKV